MPITVENVRPVLEKTSNLNALCELLNIPAKKRDDAVTAAEYFVNYVTQYRRWKWIIWVLDCVGDTDVAESIMENAEPSAGVCICILYIMLPVINFFLHMSIVFPLKLIVKCFVGSV